MIAQLINSRQSIRTFTRQAVAIEDALKTKVNEIYQYPELKAQYQPVFHIILKNDLSPICQSAV